MSFGRDSDHIVIGTAFDFNIKRIYGEDIIFSDKVYVVFSGKCVRIFSRHNLSAGAPACETVTEVLGSCDSDIDILINSSCSGSDSHRTGLYDCGNSSNYICRHRDFRARHLTLDYHVVESDSLVVAE